MIYHNHNNHNNNCVKLTLLDVWGVRLEESVSRSGCQAPDGSIALQLDGISDGGLSFLLRIYTHFMCLCQIFIYRER